jgi:hypothetical protein
VYYLAKYYMLMFMQATPIVGTTERTIAGVSCGQFGTVRPKFLLSTSGEPLDTEIFAHESRLAAEKGIGY